MRRDGSYSFTTSSLHTMTSRPQQHDHNNGNHPHDACANRPDITSNNLTSDDSTSRRTPTGPR